MALVVQQKKIREKMANFFPTILGQLRNLAIQKAFQAKNATSIVARVLIHNSHE